MRTPQSLARRVLGGWSIVVVVKSTRMNLCRSQISWTDPVGSVPRRVRPRWYGRGAARLGSGCVTCDAGVRPPECRRRTDVTNMSVSLCRASRSDSLARDGHIGPLWLMRWREFSGRYSRDCCVQSAHVTQQLFLVARLEEKYEIKSYEALLRGTCCSQTLLLKKACPRDVSSYV